MLCKIEVIDRQKMKNYFSTNYIVVTSKRPDTLNLADDIILSVM